MTSAPHLLTVLENGKQRAMKLLVPKEAVAVQLFRIDRKERLLACEAVQFMRGAPAIDMTLRRAAISGRVEVEGKIQDHFADIFNEQGDMIATIALDRKSYAALKNKWMRCKMEPAE